MNRKNQREQYPGGGGNGNGDGDEIPDEIEMGDVMMMQTTNQHQQEQARDYRGGGEGGRGGENVNKKRIYLEKLVPEEMRRPKLKGVVTGHRPYPICWVSPHFEFPKSPN